MSIKTARQLRKNMTDAERVLWRWLRGRRMEKWTFRRQEPIDAYIVDFVCFKARLVIEVDGGQHSESRADCKRDAYLRSRGFHILRFWNNVVLSNPEGIQQALADALEGNP